MKGRSLGSITDQRKGPRDRRVGIRERRTGGPARRRVLIVGRATVLIEALASALDSQPDIEVVAITESVSDEVPHLVSGPDVAVMTLDAKDGIEAQAIKMGEVRQLQSGYPDLRVLILAGDITPALLVDAASAGVSALLPFDTALSDLIVAVRASVGRNMIVTQSALLSSVSFAVVRESGTGPHQLGLTPREVEILGLLGRQVDLRTIASMLNISIHTCRGHVKRLLKKLDAHSQEEAIDKAARLGMLPPTTSFPPKPLAGISRT